MNRKALLAVAVIASWTLLLWLAPGSSAKEKRMHEIHPTARIHPSVILEGKVRVGAYTRIDAGTVVTGDVTIGHHSLIRCNVTIRGRNRIGNFTHVYDNVCIEGGRPAKVGSSTAEAPDHSIIGDYCWVNHGATMHGTQIADELVQERDRIEACIRKVRSIQARVASAHLEDVEPG